MSELEPLARDFTVLHIGLMESALNYVFRTVLQRPAEIGLAFMMPLAPYIGLWETLDFA